MKESIVLPPDAKESGIKVRPPQGCEVDEIKVVDGFLTVTFREKERKLPKSWEEFCRMFPIKKEEFVISSNTSLLFKANDNPLYDNSKKTRYFCNKNVLPDRATAEAVLALCQLTQLRNCYNGDWVPDWDDEEQDKYVITFVCCDEITITNSYNDAYSPLYFKNEKLAKEFLRCFRPLIEKLKPLYGVKKGGEE